MNQEWRVERKGKWISVSVPGIDAFAFDEVGMYRRLVYWVSKQSLSRDDKRAIRRAVLIEAYGYYGMSRFGSNVVSEIDAVTEGRRRLLFVVCLIVICFFMFVLAGVI